MNTSIPSVEPGPLLATAGVFTVLVVLSWLVLRICFPETWWTLAFKLRAWSEARRVLAAGATDSIIKQTEITLARMCFETRQVLSLSDAVRAWDYIQLAGDDLAGHRRYVTGFLLMAVLISIDGAGLGYTLAPVAGVNVSEQMLMTQAMVAGAIGAILMAFFMHAAGRHLHRYRVTREVRPRILSEGAPLPDKMINLQNSQDLDQDASPSARIYARAVHSTTLLPVILVVALVLFVAAALWNLRHEELVQLRAAGVDWLPTDAAVLTGVTALSILFAAFQFAVLWVAYGSAWTGRESADACRRLLNGTLRTQWDVTRHNSSALTFANAVHLRFHQHLDRINSIKGYRPLRPVIYPDEVLAQMLMEPVVTENVRPLISG